MKVQANKKTAVAKVRVKATSKPKVKKTARTLAIKERKKTVKAVAKSSAKKSAKTNRVSKTKTQTTKKITVDKKTRAVKTVIKSGKMNAIAVANESSQQKQRSRNNFTAEQKEKMLKLIEMIIHLRDSQREGLGSFEKIERILDEYNQHYKTVLEKFDAIIEYGMKKDPAFVPKNVFVPVKQKSEYEIKLYAILEHIWEGAIKYQDAFNQMNSIYMGSLTEKNHNHYDHEFE